MTRTQSLLFLAAALTGCPAVVPEEPVPEEAEVLPAEGEWALRLSEVYAYGDCGGYGAEPMPAEWYEDGDEDGSREGEDAETLELCTEGDEGLDCVEPDPGYGYGYGYGYDLFGDVLVQMDVRQQGRRGFSMDIEGMRLFAEVREGRFEASGGEHWHYGMPGIVDGDPGEAVDEGGASVDCEIIEDDEGDEEEYCAMPEPEPDYGVSMFAEGELEGPTAMHGWAWVDIVEGGWYCSLELRFDAARLSGFRDRGDWDEPVVVAESAPAELGY